MSVFLEIANNYAVADAAFAAAELNAFQDDDDTAFDQAGLARQHNDQAYFLYLFSRFEAAVNASSAALLATRLPPYQLGRSVAFGKPGLAVRSVK